jgi:hypothetical protein
MLVIYSEPSIYRFRMFRFPGSVVQFPWAHEQILFKHGPRIYRFPIYIVSFQDPRRKGWIDSHTMCILHFHHVLVTDCAANYRPVLSSEKTPQILADWPSVTKATWTFSLSSGEPLGVQASEPYKHDSTKIQSTTQKETESQENYRRKLEHCKI